MAPECTPGEALDLARRDIGVELTALWVEYFALGGTASPAAIGEYLGGRPTLDNAQHDVLAHAINEIALDLGADHPAPYMRT